MNKYPSWFIGAVAEQDKSHKDGTSHGVRYRVRRLGIDPPVGDLPDNKLPSFDCLLPLTASGGDNQKGRSVNLDPGDLVFGLHTDAPDHQRGVIIGVLPRTSLINYDNLIKTGDLTTASGADLNKMSQPVQKNETPSKAGDDLTATPAEKKVIAAVNRSNEVPDPNEQTTAKEGEYESLWAEGEVPYGASTGNPDTTSGSRPVVTRTADNFLNSTFKTRETRIADTPTADQLTKIQAQGYKFIPNTDGTDGGTLVNPEIYTE